MSLEKVKNLGLRPRFSVFQHFPRDLANVNEWKIMFDPSNQIKPNLSIMMQMRERNTASVTGIANSTIKIALSLTLSVKFEPVLWISILVPILVTYRTNDDLGEHSHSPSLAILQVVMLTVRSTLAYDI